MDLIFKQLTDAEREYSLIAKTATSEDTILLDQATTTGLIQFGVTQMPYPKIWKHNKEFKLPFHYFKIKKYENVVIETVGDTLPFYDEGTRVKISTKVPTMAGKKIFPALNFGGNSWQHFIQDVLPIIYFAKDLLISNQDISILLYDGVERNIVNFVFEKLNITNDLIFIPYKSNVVAKVDTLLNFESNTQVPTQWWPLFLYKEINNTLLNNETTTRKNIIYNKRSNSRQVSNEAEVLTCLQEYADINNLNLIEFQAERYSIQERFEIFKNAHTIVAPHGGANYNIIFSNPKAKFVEYVFTDCMYTLANLAGGIGLDYYLVPGPGNNNSPSVVVDITKLKIILNK